MSFRILGLDPEPFTPLFGASDETLAAQGIKRVCVDAPNAAPCRVTLEDAKPGETVLLLSHEHQPAHTPYRQSGPIFVRENASRRFDQTGAVPPAILRRTVSARGYDHTGMMVEGELVEGSGLAALLEDWLARPSVAEVHLHYARRGCFAARAVRV
ncbi:MAG TPA: DUF1203 domain-containing protein [Caulobacteraceae bacterium]|jgi:hypothetical protein